MAAEKLADITSKHPDMPTAVHIDAGRRLAQDILSYVEQGKLSLKDVMSEFVQENCPYFFTTMQIPPGGITARDFGYFISQTTFSTGHSPVDGGVLLYQVLNLTPERARLVYPSFFSSDGYDHSDSMDAEAIESLVGLKSGTLSEMYKEEMSSFEFSPETFINDDRMWEILEIVVDTYWGSKKFGITPEMLDNHVEKMIAEKPIQTEHFIDKDAHYTVNKLIRLIVKLERQHELKSMFSPGISEADLQAAESFFGFDDKFVAKGKSLTKDWDEIDFHLHAIDAAIQVRGSLDLRSRKGIAMYLLMSLNQADWDMRLNQIKKENFNDYPHDFFSLIYGSSAGLGWSTPDLEHASIANITLTRWKNIKAKANVD